MGSEMCIRDSHPSGGSGNLEYYWQYRTRSACSSGNYGPWTNWVRTASAQFNGGTIDHQFRRGVKRAYCDVDPKYGNTITFDVYQSFTNGGTISDRSTTYCGTINPATLGNTANPSGGCSGGLEFRWRVQSRNACSTTWGGWSTISGATGASYDPPSFSNDRQYAREARRNGCSGWVNSNIVTFDAQSPLTNAGTISGGSTLCSGANLPRITGPAASGGCGGSLQYQWQVSSKAICSGVNAWSGWTNVNNATGTTYDPGVATKDFRYRRAAKRVLVVAGYTQTS